MTPGRNLTRMVVDYLRLARNQPDEAVAKVERLTFAEAAAYVLVLTEWLLTEVNGRFDVWARRLEDDGQL